MNRKGREKRKDNGACKTQGGPGGQDRAVEPQHRRDHLPQDYEADRQYQRDAAVWGTGRRGTFSLTRGPGRG